MVFGKKINYYYKKYAVFYLLGIIALVLVDYYQLEIPEVLGDIIDGIEENELTKEVLKDSVLSIITFVLVVYFGRFIWRLCIFGASRNIDYGLRNEMFAHAEKLDAEYYSNHKTGGLMAYFTNDLESVRMAAGPGVIMMFDAIFLGALAIYKMARLDWRLTLLSAIPIFFISLLGIILGNKIEERFSSRQKAYEKLSDFTNENYSGISVIKAFVKETKEKLAFAKINKENKEINIKVVRLSTIMQVASIAVVTIVIIIILMYGGTIVYNNHGVNDNFNSGDLYEFLNYFIALIWPMNALARVVNIRSQAKASLRRITSVLEEEVSIYDHENCLDIDEVYGDIEFRNLNFAYSDDPDTLILKDVSFHINRGETVGIVGKTGSGKTSLVDLMLHIYNVDRNTLFMDGVDMMDIPLKSLRNSFGYVPQDGFLFTDYIKDNIALGIEKYNDYFDKVIEASKISDVHKNIIEFPDQYETIVGERGVTLSGGQKQRVSIARALVKDPNILIMDDSVSAVDTNTEEIILSNLRKIRKNKTTIIIAHRISTLVNADKIILIDDGKISDVGTHYDLIERNELYKDIVNRQKLDEENKEG